jgi:hypothetical protein
MSPAERLLPEAQQRAEQYHRRQHDNRLERPIVRRGKDHIREQRNDADGKQHAVERGDECMEELPVPRGRLLMGYFVETISFLPHCDLPFAQASSRRFEPFERLLGGTFAELQ